MRIINLIENTQGDNACLFDHGLSLYFETSNHRILFDFGPSDDILKNAETLGIDLRSVDVCILSHGHYDHSGGIIGFSKIDPNAVIFIQRTAIQPFFADDGADAMDRYRYIGIDSKISDLSSIELINGDHKIDDELELFTIVNKPFELPFSNKRLLRRVGEDMIPDDFSHEQYLVIRENDKTVLVSGCAHNGILNIMQNFCDRYGKAPDALISGFHLMLRRPYREEELKYIEQMALKLKEYPTLFFTCHCTGTEAFEILKQTMGSQLVYVHSGEEINEF